MLDLTDEQKEAFYLPGYSNTYEIAFADIDLIIVNETLHTETVEIKESICEEEDFVLGGCIASSIEFTVSEIIANQISGLEFTVRLNVSQEGNPVLSMPMGIYRVDSAKRVDDKDYKKITAFDRMYDASVDVSGWYNKLFPITGTQFVPSGEQDEDGNAILVERNIYGTTTVKAMRESLLGHLGIPYASQTLPNDGMTVEKTVEPSEGSLPGTTVLKALCTVNGGFGRMNREGKFEVIHVKGLGLFPEDSKGAAVPMEEGGNVYPEETLYPEDGFQCLGMSDEEVECPEYRSVTYEEYMTRPITCLNIQSDEEDVGVTIGDDVTNPYVITANFLLYGKTADELRAVGENIFRRIQGITYRPASTELDGLPYLEAGDVYALEKRTDIVESYIFSRTLTGIQALKDQYEAKGNEIRANEVTPAEEIQILKRKTLKIQKSVEGVSVELEDLDKQTKSRFEQTDEKITAEVEDARKELNASIETTAGNIVLKVDSKGNMAEVALGVDADDPTATRFAVTAKNIELSAEEAINLLAGGTINLSAEKGIEITSPYFSVDKKGDVVARSIEITGGKINFATSLEGDSSILLRNAKYEGAYSGPVRFTGHAAPDKSPEEMGAVLGDVYYDYKNAAAYESREPFSGSGSSGVYWAYIVLNESDIPPSLCIRFYGAGEPEDSPENMDARPGEIYIDLETGHYYICYISNGELGWGDTGTGDITKINEWTEISLNTEDGLSAEKYYYRKYPVEEGGNISPTESLEKNSSRCSVGPDGISFNITDHRFCKGSLVEQSAEAHISAGFSENNLQSDEAPYAILCSDTPFRAPNLKSGTVSRNMNANAPYYVEIVNLNMPDVPNVVVTPITINPSAVSVSVADVSESGFKIYMYRTDGNYPLAVNWIAMC